MESLIFEKDIEKLIINALRITGYMEYDSEMADIGNGEKIFIVTEKVNKDKEDDEAFKYGISKIVEDKETGLEKLWKEWIEGDMIDECKDLRINNITNLPLYYLLDYKNAISTDYETMKDSMKITISDEDTNEDIKNKYVYYHMKEIVKNMKNNGYLDLENVDLDSLISSLTKFLEELLKSYIYVGMQFHDTFKDLTIENLDEEIKLYPNCKELQDMRKALEENK